MSEVFDNVICGVDGSEEGLAAARLAARVASESGRLAVIAVEDESLAVHAGWGATAVAEQLEREAATAATAARIEAGRQHEAEQAVLRGDPIGCLLDQIRTRGATLVVVGAHGHSRAAGIVLGSVASALLHDAPSAVLLARPVADVGAWPRHVVVGLDGSEGSRAALDAARALAVRFGAEVRTVVATRDRHAEPPKARALDAGVEEHDADPVDALVVLGEQADLLVVGSRGLKGLRALGSVSERVAHQADCPVLVVRGASEPDAR